jgi:hypothetical protein
MGQLVQSVVEPIMKSGGNTHVTTSGTGTNFTAFAAQPCQQLTVVNNTGTDVEVQQGGTGDTLPVINGSAYPFYGLTDASQLSIRRIDTSNTTVTVKARWEA